MKYYTAYSDTILAIDIQYTRWQQSGAIYIAETTFIDSLEYLLSTPARLMADAAK